MKLESTIKHVQDSTLVTLIIYMLAENDNDNQGVFSYSDCDLKKHDEFKKLSDLQTIDVGIDDTESSRRGLALLIITFTGNNEVQIIRQAQVLVEYLNGKHDIKPPTNFESRSDIGYYPPAYLSVSHYWRQNVTPIQPRGQSVKK